MVYLKYKNHALIKKSQTVQQDNLGFFYILWPIVKIRPPSVFWANFKFQIPNSKISLEI